MRWTLVGRDMIDVNYPQPPHSIELIECWSPSGALVIVVRDCASNQLAVTVHPDPLHQASPIASSSPTEQSASAAPARSSSDPSPERSRA